MRLRSTKPFINDVAQTAYLNKTNGFSLGIPGAPAQRSLNGFINKDGLGLDVSYCVVGDNGRVGYMLEHGLVDDAPGATQVLAAESGQVPSLASSVQFDALTFIDNQSVPMYFAMNPSGVFVLPAILSGAGVEKSGTFNINDQAVLRGPAGDFKSIARAGEIAPGLPSGLRLRRTGEPGILTR